MSTYASQYIAAIKASKSADAAKMTVAKLTVASAFLNGETKKDFMAECRQTFRDAENKVLPQYASAENYVTRAWACVRGLPGVAEVWQKDGGGISLLKAYDKVPKRANVGRTKKSKTQRVFEAWSRLDASEKEICATQIQKGLADFKVAQKAAAEVQKILAVATPEL